MKNRKGKECNEGLEEMEACRNTGKKSDVSMDEIEKKEKKEYEEERRKEISEKMVRVERVER